MRRRKGVIFTDLPGNPHYATEMSRGSFCSAPSALLSKKDVMVLLLGWNGTECVDFEIRELMMTED
jgi:hypothetical protein